MPSDTTPLLSNGSVNRSSSQTADFKKLNEQLKKARGQWSSFHGDELLGNKQAPKGKLAGWKNTMTDLRRVFTFKNLPAIASTATKALAGKGLDARSAAPLVASLAKDSNLKADFIEKQVKIKYERMLHPPLTYLGDAFKYRTADGKFNNPMNPHLGQAGAPYARSVPSKTAQLGALPDPGDLFDRLMARQEGGRPSKSGLSNMLLYHATIIIHDIFRTNDKDKNISDSSSYLDLSPLYGYTEEMQRKVRDDKYKLGLLKPDTFAEDRLLRQPPGVCIMLVMYNRYHNYAATQLYRINENDRFKVPKKYEGIKLVAIAKSFVPKESRDMAFMDACETYEQAWEAWDAKDRPKDDSDFESATKAVEDFISHAGADSSKRRAFEEAYDAAWNKLDDDLFHTARLITCGMYIQVSIHDYLRALMGFHQFDTTFTLDPRVQNKHKEVHRGEGNQVTIEFNCLYRFHCAISKSDEEYTETFIRQKAGGRDPNSIPFEDFLKLMKYESGDKQKNKAPEPWETVFGLPSSTDHPELVYKRNPITGLFDDEQMINQLLKSMDEPLSNFGPRNIPRCLRNIEIMGIQQCRKWEVGTLNDFREFFGMYRHQTFESITGNKEIQDALRDLYEHPDKVELYPGVFCESDENMNCDPGPSDVNSALWAAIFSDAITLVRSDRFYTVDWSASSLTAWGLKEVNPDMDLLKSSVFHRLIQRAFPGWFPYNSVRFFHPFYTAQTNAKYAFDQGYAAEFRMGTNKNSKGEFEIAKSNPEKPWKPIYLTKDDDITAFLSDTSDSFIHPARSETTGLPPKVAEVLKPRTAKKKQKSQSEAITFDLDAMTKYLVNLMRNIVKRESIMMDSKKETYQIDITRDFAVPVTTRIVADILGFGNQIKTMANPGGKCSENEIYQHITNCQTFLAYNADETKMLKRRRAYRQSMNFLYDLTKNGTIYEASRSSVGKFFLGKKPTNPMMDLGYRVAKDIVKNERDSGRAAAILLLIALDSAYNSVLSFTSVLNYFVEHLYDSVNLDGSVSDYKADVWRNVQKLALQNTPQSVKTLQKLVLDAQRSSVHLPIIRKAAKDVDFKDSNGVSIFNAKKGQVVIADVWQAKRDDPDAFPDDGYVAAQSSFIETAQEYHPKQLSLLNLTAMIKAVAQMKNLRRGHDAQGYLKKIDIDASNEGYSNYMAPLRVKRIAELAKNQSSSIFEEHILKPANVTFLTATWDEMVPFPTTWKVRFDGFGESTYGGDTLPVLKRPQIDDDAPPFYQPQGPSHVGGTFATVECICNTPGNKCQCKSGAAKDEKDDKDEEADDLGEYDDLEDHEIKIVKRNKTYNKVETYSAGCGALGS